MRFAPLRRRQRSTASSRHARKTRHRLRAIASMPTSASAFSHARRFQPGAGDVQGPKKLTFDAGDQQVVVIAKLPTQSAPAARLPALRVPTGTYRVEQAAVPVPSARPSLSFRRSRAGEAVWDANSSDVSQQGRRLVDQSVAAKGHIHEPARTCLKASRNAGPPAMVGQSACPDFPSDGVGSRPLADCLLKRPAAVAGTSFACSASVADDRFLSRPAFLRPAADPRMRTDPGDGGRR